MRHNAGKRSCCLFQKCLVVAVGSGFAVFDVVTGKLLTDRRNAHKLKILHMEFIKERLETILLKDYQWLQYDS